MIQVKCKLTLQHGDGTESFTKGNVYDVINVPMYDSSKTYIVTNHTTCLNNQNEPHRLALWAKHFNLNT